MRRAIALIELIFAIVVIAITLISVPNLISTTTKASNNAITQEAISNASSYLNLIMSSFWDEESTEPKLENPLLYVTKEDIALKEANISGYLIGRRVGSPKSTSRRFKNKLTGLGRVTATIPSKLGFETAETIPDDIDDFNNRTITLVNVQTASATTGDYKDKSVQITTTVKYLKDSPKVGAGYKNIETLEFINPFDNKNIETKGSSNIKIITLNLSSKYNKNEKIVLKAFSCNIGASKLKEKKF